MLWLIIYSVSSSIYSRVLGGGHEWELEIPDSWMGIFAFYGDKNQNVKIYQKGSGVTSYHRFFVLTRGSYTITSEKDIKYVMIFENAQFCKNAFLLGTAKKLNISLRQTHLCGLFLDPDFTSITLSDGYILINENGDPVTKTSIGQLTYIRSKNLSTASLLNLVVEYTVTDEFECGIFRFSDINGYDYGDLSGTDNCNSDTDDPGDSDEGFKFSDYVLSAVAIIIVIIIIILICKCCPECPGKVCGCICNCCTCCLDYCNQASRESEARRQREFHMNMMAHHEELGV